MRITVMCVILLTGAVVAVATTQAVREESKCGDEALIWKPCEDEDQSLLRDFVQGDRRARVVPDGFFARAALLLQAG